MKLTRGASQVFIVGYIGPSEVDLGFFGGVDLDLSIRNETNRGIYSRLGRSEICSFLIG